MSVVFKFGTTLYHISQKVSYKFISYLLLTTSNFNSLLTSFQFRLTVSAFNLFSLICVI